MDWQIELSRRAELDIEESFERIAVDSRQHAIRWRQSLEQTLSRLRTQATIHGFPKTVMLDAKSARCCFVSIGFFTRSSLKLCEY
jgi:hypothetical protein